MAAEALEEAGSPEEVLVAIESKLITYEDYLLLPELNRRYEIIDGELVRKAMPSPKHARSQAALTGKLFGPYSRRSGGPPERPGGWWFLTEVEADGPAAKAGLRAGDVIVNVEGRTDELSEGLRRALDSAASGAGVALGVQREGHRVEMKVVPRGEGRAVRAPRKTI